jgi:hypothetical protein
LPKTPFCGKFGDRYRYWAKYYFRIADHSGVSDEMAFVGTNPEIATLVNCQSLVQGRVKRKAGTICPDTSNTKAFSMTHTLPRFAIATQLN